MTRSRSSSERSTSGAEGPYGAPRIQAKLVDEDTSVGTKRVARLTRDVGLCGVSRRKGARTTRREHDTHPAPGLVQWGFESEVPDQPWVSDITYVPI